MKASRTALRRHYLGAEIVGQADFIDATEAALALYVATEAYGGGELALRLIRQRTFSGNKQSERNVDVDDDAWQRPVVEYAAHLAAADYRRARIDATPPSDRVDAEVWSTYFMLDMLLELNADDESMDRAFRLVVTDSLAYIRSSSANMLPNGTARESSLLRRVFRGLYSLVVRRRAAWRQIEIVGSAAFIRNTQEALELLKTSRHAANIFDNLGTIYQSTSRHIDAGFNYHAFIKVDHEHPQVHVAAWLGLTLPPLEYACLLAHEAHHNMQYRDDQECEGTEAERACIDFEREVLRDLAAPEYLLRKTERQKLLPIPGMPPDDYYFRQIDWRIFR